MAASGLQRSVPWAGLLFLTVGLATVLLSSTIRSAGVTSSHDPGPRLVPLILGWILIAGGAGEVICALRRRRDEDAAVEAGPAANPAAGASWSFGIGMRAVELVVGFPVYLLAMTWLGFHLSTGLMVMAMLCRLGVVWWRALLAGAVLVGAVHLLFGMVFRVALPGGFWS